MRFPRKRGSTSVIVRVFIPDNSVTTGAGVTGLTSASTNLAIAYARELQNGATQITGANIVTITTIGTWSNPGTGKLGFKAVDATNMPGVYEIHFPDDAAAFGTGDTSQNVIINVLELTTTALKIGPNLVLIPLVPWDYQDGVRMGLTALPNAAANAAGGLPISAAGALAMDGISAGVWDVDATAHQTQGTFGQAIGDPVADSNTIYKAVVTDADGATIGVDVTNLPTNTELATALGTADDAVLVAIGALNNITAASVWDVDATAHQTQGTFGQAIGDPGADANTIFKAVVTDADGATVGVDVTNLPTNTELATALGTADDAVLVAIGALNNITAASVWDVDATAHQTQGTFGQAIGDPAADSNTIYKAVVTDADGATVGVDVTNLPTNAELATALGTADDAVLVAVAAMNNLSQSDVRAAVGLGSANLDTQLDALPTNTELATALGTADDAVLAQVALVKAKTDNLPADPANASDIAGAFSTVNSTLTTIAGYIDTEVTAIKTKTDQLTFTVANKVDANPTAINGDATAAANLAKTTRATVRGTATSGGSTTSIPTSAFTPSGAAADQFKGMVLKFDADTTTAALRSQTTEITASSNSATPTLTVVDLTHAPASGDTFSVQ